MGGEGGGRDIYFVGSRPCMWVLREVCGATCVHDNTSKQLHDIHSLYPTFSTPFSLYPYLPHPFFSSSLHSPLLCLLLCAATPPFSSFLSMGLSPFSPYTSQYGTFSHPCLPLPVSVSLISLLPVLPSSMSPTSPSSPSLPCHLSCSIPSVNVFTQ